VRIPNLLGKFGWFALALSTVPPVAVVRWLVSPWLGNQGALILFIPAIMVATWYGGLWPGLAAMLLAVVVGDSAVAHPAGIFVLQNHEAIRITMFLLVGLQVAGGTELLHRRTKQARAASDAKDYFIRALSHELRTPLTPALVAAAALDADPTVPDTLREQVQIIRRNISLEVRLVDDLLDISRIQKGKIQLKRETVDLEQIVQAAVATCRQAITDKHLRLQIHAEGGPYHVNADPTRLQQIFWNLLRNAVKFTPDSGSVTINITESNTGTVTTQITDTGIGIPQDVLPKVFNAFEQGDTSIPQQFGGLGLGLAITKSLVEMHGGTICAASEGAGRGTSFLVNLPLSLFPLVVHQDAPALVSTPNTTTSLRILYVEDHPDTAKVVARLLKNMGYQVTSAGSLQECLVCAKRQTFDLLISDLALPDGDGSDLCRQLAAQGHLIQAIALTGYGMPEDIVRTRASGFSAHLTKPLDIAELQQTIAALARQVRPGRQVTKSDPKCRSSAPL
jgi:signal transduction histidine kinase/CheY-like chemotaxis protein